MSIVEKREERDSNFVRSENRKKLLGRFIDAMNEDVEFRDKAMDAIYNLLKEYKPMPFKA